MQHLSLSKLTLDEVSVLICVEVGGQGQTWEISQGLEETKILALFFDPAEDTIRGLLHSEFWHRENLYRHGVNSVYVVMGSVFWRPRRNFKEDSR